MLANPSVDLPPYISFADISGAIIHVLINVAGYKILKSRLRKLDPDIRYKAHFNAVVRYVITCKRLACSEEEFRPLPGAQLILIL